jgi:histidine triad (HIT) family protein
MHEPKDYICPFCELAAGKDTTDNVSKQQYVFYKDADTTAFISSDTWPSNAGNALIIPNNHSENIYDISDEDLAKTYKTAKKVAKAMKVVYGCSGTSMRQHNEPDGNQNVWHFHVHVLPRYKDDQLYQNHKNKRPMTPEEREKYTTQLKEYFNT